jgi:hypothetical protein
MDSPSNPTDVGDLLLQQGKLTERQLELARRRQSRLEMPQHRAIIDLNYASEERTLTGLSQFSTALSSSICAGKCLPAKPFNRCL